MVRASIWQIAALALIGPCLSLCSEWPRPTIRRAVPIGSAPRPAQDAPKQEAGADSARKPDLHPKPPEPVPDGEITAAIERGVAFLLKDQNVDGSWGSPERTKDLNIIAGIGSHHAFRTAVTVALRLGPDRGERARAARCRTRPRSGVRLNAARISCSASCRWSAATIPC